MKIWLPLDSFAVAMGGDEVAEAILAEAGKRGVKVSLTRNGSRGMVCEGKGPVSDSRNATMSATSWSGSVRFSCVEAITRTASSRVLASMM